MQKFKNITPVRWLRLPLLAFGLFVAAGSASADTSTVSLKITTTSLPAGVTGVPYTQTLATTGGNPPLNWVVSGGTLPPGLALDAAAGTLAGTPSAAGNWAFQLRATDSTAATAARAFSFKVYAPGTAPLAITTTTLPDATVGSPYAQQLTATGGKPPYSWVVTSGGLPDGLTLNPSTGQITGNAVDGGAWIYQYLFQVYITVKDSAAATTAMAYFFHVLPPPHYALSVVNGSGSGSFAANATVAIAANAAPAGQVFASWTGAAVANPASPHTTLLMPAANATVTATYTAAPPPINQFTLSVINGSGGGSFAANSTVAISANPAPAGLAFAGWSGAAVANPSSPNTTLVMPAANTSVTANYSNLAPPVAHFTLTVVNGSGGGSYAANTTVAIAANAAPAGQIFSGWTGAPVNDASSPNTTLVMPAANTTVTASYGLAPPAVTTIPQPVSAHPRLWVTPADLPRLRSWAVPSNPIYQQGLVPLLATVNQNYQNQFFPGGVANPNYPDFGDTQGYAGLLTEQNALLLAFQSLIDPSPAARQLNAQRARNLLMVAMNEAVKGALPDAPFRDRLFVVYNRGNFTSEAWPLIVDWIYNATDAGGNAILTATDKATIRLVFLRWASECINASTTGGDHPSPVGSTNRAFLLPGGNAYRMASNNYYAGHARLVTLMSLALDPADDQPINPNLPETVLGNTMRSYIANATGAWLLQQFAMLGDPATVRGALNLPAGGSVGLASGGLPPEGMLYGHSYAYLLGELLALHTAGFDDPALSGPQIGLIGAPVWDRFVQGFISSLVPAAQIPPSDAYLGPVYEMASYGDLLRLWITPDYMEPFALLNLLDQKTGNASRDQAERWFVVNAIEGGAAGLLNRVQNSWSYGVQSSVLYFMTLDPAVAPAPDPRPGYATAFYDAPAGPLLARTDWSPGATMFDFRASWISINHQDADAGLFELYRKGEWLTKEASNYDNVGNGQSSMWHNTLSLQNWCTGGVPNLNWFEVPLFQNGSQWQLGMSSGDPVTISSTGATYAFAQTDMTKLYNRPSVWQPQSALMDIQHASRSILWLNPDFIVVYDRATSLHSGLFKRFNLDFTSHPAINGNLVTAITPHGQKLYVQSLLPANASISYLPTSSSLPNVAWLEPSVGRISVEDPSNPADIRFLHVLQAADAATPVAPAAVVQSSAGSAFAGACAGSAVALFPVNLGGAFAGTAYSAPASAVHHFITGLTPGAGYAVTASSDGTTAQLAVSVGGPLVADSAGVLVFDLAAVLP